MAIMSLCPVSGVYTVCDVSFLIYYGGSGSMPTKTEPTPYGLRSTISGFISVDEVNAWRRDYERIVPSRQPGFGQLVDLREQKAYTPEVGVVIQDVMRYVRENGMARSAVILASAMTKMQISRLAKETGMYEYERYFDASSDADWERKAIDWIERAVDPDKS